MNRSVLRPITEDEIRTFWNDGVVYLGCMFDADWVERAGAAIDEAPGAYGERNFIWPVSEAIRELVFDSPVGEIAAALLRSKTIGHMGDIEWVKDPHSESLTPWHQDQPYLQLAGRQTCNLWIGIDAATGENGAVEWVKGSHDWGKVFEPEPFDGSAPKDVRPGRERVPDFDNLRGQYDVVRFDTEPGDCIVGHGMMVHSAGPNRTDQPRRAISHNLFGDDARYAAIPPSRRAAVWRTPRITASRTASRSRPIMRCCRASGPSVPAPNGPGRRAGAICPAGRRPIAMRAFRESGQTPPPANKAHHSGPNGARL